ncbi:POP1-domain-containing protein [Daedalea quercina L-15889]|uniref:POP1-domain-containing protein n=1 Tax=Daedalea quercina L-15889 TaxID=1314783 RepID=A0A165TTP3_9APHY|nr:POP1-domain-containing protein [Daedalea quercina L-15889]
MAPSKRRSDDSESPDPPTARDRKKQKTALARTIPVQSAQASTTKTAAAGPSKSVRFNSMQGLPASIDVERFAEARAFEINAMEETMKSAQGTSTKRAWQELPRHLRRRAASHDVRRVPLRLREKARAEMDPQRKKALGRHIPKRGKSKQIPRTKQFLKRQIDKTWLETHIWHAKRMHMKNIWGYRLAVEPTEKSFRPSHRASVHGSILHDASYLALIELIGPEDILRAILDSCSDLQGPSPGAKRFLTGARVCETHLYKHRTYPFDLIAPMTVIWQPIVQSTSKPEAQHERDGSKSKKHRRGGKGKEKEQETTSSLARTARKVWIRVHPFAVHIAHQALRIAASYALDAWRSAAPNRGEVEVEIADLREHVNVFEIMGPKSSQVIKGALKPTKDIEGDDFRMFWDSLDRLQCTGSLPRGMVMGFTVHDPRLSFPPKNAKLDCTVTSSPVALLPSAKLARSDIWDEGRRNGLRKPRYKKKDIDQRKSQNLVPGTPLQPTQKDSRIPVMLIQRSIESASPISPSSPHHTSSSTALHGWTLIIPQGWAMAFLPSLIHTGTRVGGQRERQTQAYEGGCAYFPRDYPFTDAYEEYADEREIEEQEQWERKPPAKRVNYAKIGTRSPWKPDWEVVLGLRDPPAPEAEDPDSELIPAQRVDVEISATEQLPPDTSTQMGKNEQQVRPWLLCGQDVPSILQNTSSMFNPSAGLLDCIDQLRIKRGLDPLGSSVRANELWKGALVRVRVLLCGRGNPKDLALIYRVDDEEAKKWNEAEALREQGIPSLLEVHADETELSKLAPSPAAIIGYVTTGHFSLSRGEGHAIGAIPVSCVFDLQQQAERLRTPDSLLIKVRDRSETICRAARLEILT